MEQLFVVEVGNPEEKKKKKHNKVKQVLDSKKPLKLANTRYIEDAQTQLSFLHEGHDGFVTIALKQHDVKNDYHEWHLKPEELAEHIEKFIQMGDNMHVYMSNNAFYRCSRKTQNVRHLKVLWSDVDYYEIPELKGKPPKEVIEIMRKDGKFNDIEPSFFVYSGKGLYIMWLIESAPIQALPLWQVLMDKIYEDFKQYGADTGAVDASRVLRLAGTVNPKTKNRAEIIFNSTKILKSEAKKEVRVYTLKYLQDTLLPSLPYTKQELEQLKADRKKVKKDKAKKKKESSSGTAKVRSMYNLYNLNYARLEDLKTLIEIREGYCDLKNKKIGGCRELMVFLYRYWSCCFSRDKDKALEAALEFNELFKDPLTEYEVIKHTKSAEDAYDNWEKTFNQFLELHKQGKTPHMINYFRARGCYVYSNKTLIKKLMIQEWEMEHLKTIINTKEKNRRAKDYRNKWLKDYRKKKRRNKNGLTSREQAKEDNINVIMNLLDEGKKQKEIAEIVGLAKSTISEYVKEIKARKESQELEIEPYSIDIPRIDTSDLDLIIAI